MRGPGVSFGHHIADLFFKINIPCLILFLTDFYPILIHIFLFNSPPTIQTLIRKKNTIPNIKPMISPKQNIMFSPPIL